MNFQSVQFAAIVENAKKAAANSPRWTRAITRAADALRSGEIVASLLHNGALVSSPRGCYFVNSRYECECEASRRGHKECRHVAAVRLCERLEAAPAEAAAPVRRPTITRSIERNYNGPAIAVYRAGCFTV